MQPWTDSLAALQGSHDLRLSAWGPFSMQYLGISHIPDKEAGLRFDLSVFPTMYRRTAHCPNAKRDSGVWPWEAASDLSYYRFRHELIWKDQLYGDVDYCRLDENAVLVCAHLVNNTSVVQQVGMQYMASLHFPPLRPQSEEVLKSYRVELPPGALWVNSTSYESLFYNKFDPRENLVYDGHIRGQVLAHGFVDGTALGNGFGMNQGDSVTYRLTPISHMPDAVLVLRYRMAQGQEVHFTLTGLINGTLTLTGTGDFATTNLPVRDVTAGSHTLQLTAQEDGAELQLDGLALVPAAQLADLRFEPIVWNPTPQRLPGPNVNSFILQYDHICNVYGMAWEDMDHEVRNIKDSELEPWAHRMCIGALHQLNPTFTGKGDGHFTNLFLRPIYLQPSSEKTFYGLICTGDIEQVQRRLAAFDPTQTDYNLAHAKARAKRVNLSGTRTGEQYLFSQERMAATTLTNVIYPVRTRGTWIKHYTPGRFYESIYTWDAGFIGLGLLELDPQRALDILNTYVTAPGEPGAAFIHHGSPVPTQFYVFWELWNRTGSAELLAYFYPRLQQYHRFLMGRIKGSTTRTLKSQLIRTWDYFYNSGGWDDYPAQAYVHRNKWELTVVPVANSTHAIRTARMLRAMAAAQGLNTNEYDADIASLSTALQQYAWDAESGYFGYVCHDAAGNPISIMKDENGVNMNMGLDGITPLMANVCTPEQEALFATRLMQDDRLWSAQGISTVDQSAPYFRDDGYWNGSVWMPHQWFMWKALLDIGQADAAHSIARTGIDVWQRETDDTYACWEHINMKSGRGGGWHHFGGLSTPVLSWYGAYYRPGRITGGLNLHVESYSTDANNQALTATISVDGQPWHTPVVIVTVAVSDTYNVTWNGAPVQYTERYPGTVEVTLPAGASKGQLEVRGQSAQ